MRRQDNHSSKKLPSAENGNLTKFGAVLADPPWRFKTYNEAGRNRCPDWKTFKGSPSRHYETMSTEQICEMKIPAADDSCLFLWISWPMLREALAVIEAWGFTYKTCAFAWIKTNHNRIPIDDDEFGSVAIGTGYWTRSNSEVCLMATCGKPKRLNADVRQAIVEPRREHSRKPDCIHERIERLVAGPYLELFARHSRPGWTTWGNQSDHFETHPDERAYEIAKASGESKRQRRAFDDVWNAKK